jgi:2-succinyl-6-hydroxy-2,4-cyclohexadiene-1-carboxylate synthase
VSPLVLLHGFLSAPTAWDEVAAVVRGAVPEARVTAPWLPGHGPAASPPAGTWHAAIDALAASLPREASVVVGYSNGGRLALGLLAQHPDRIAALVLVSAHLGLDDAARPARAADDARLAAVAERDGLEGLIAEHGARPALASQARLPAEVRASIAARRRLHSPRAVAAALRVTGLGAMPDLRGALAVRRVPVVAVAGGDDAAYVGLAHEAAGLSGGRAVVVAGAGHDVVSAAPDAVARAVIDLLLAARASSGAGPASAARGARAESAS